MIRCTLLSALFVLSVTNLAAQSGDLMRVLPPSPTSREFDKYINQEVSLYNGIPSINIPLFNLRVGKTVIPIELKYHASGVKYGQTSGDVGVGWVLEPGYRISRTMNGRPDEYFDKPAVTDPFYAFTNPTLRDEYLSKFIRTHEMDIPPATELLDGEFDLFTYSAGASGGAFVIEDRQQKKVRTISGGLDTIVYAQNPQGMITNFDVLDGNGVAYRFGKELIGSNMVYEIHSGAVFSRGITPTSWLLTDMTDPFGQSARFSYTNFTEYNYFTPQTVFVQSATSENGPGPCFPTSGGISAFGAPYSQYTSQRITEIVTADVKVRFFRTQNGGIDSIVVRDLPGNNRIRKFVFNYSNNGWYMFLNTVTIFGANEVEPQVYRFNYYAQEAPWNGYFAPDYWGYLKRTSTQGYLFPDFGAMYLCSELGPQPLSAITSINRNPVNGDDAMYYTLNKITYPTGGSTSFEYEPNKYYGIRDDNSDNVKYAGIRVKKITFNDGVNGLPLIKEYLYGLNGNGFGNVAVDIAHRRYFATESVTGSCQFDGPSIDGMRLVREVTYKTVPDDELGGGGFIGSPVHYEKLVELYRQQEPGTGQWKQNGKVEYGFGLSAELAWYGYPGNNGYIGYNSILANSPSEDCGGHTLNSKSLSREFYSYYVARYATWDKPYLKNKLTFKHENGLEELLEKVENEYSTNYVELSGLKVRKFYSSPHLYTNWVNYYGYGMHSMFDYSTYLVSCGDRTLTKTTTTSYSGSVNIQLGKKISYNRYLQVIKEEADNSNLTKSIVYRHFPGDYGVISANDALSSGVRALIQKRVLAPEVETSVAKVDANGSNERTVSGVFNSYKANSPTPDVVYSLEGTPLGNFVRTSANGGALTIDTRYKPRVSFNSFDSRGNLLEQQKAGDIKEVYLWGYNGQQPVAQVIGSDYSTVASFVSTTIINAPINDQQLRVELNKIRTGLAGTKALVKTLTYTPLVGVTSETDPSGKTVFYEYDSFGRLKLIKDQNGKILKQYDYQYQSPITQ